MAELTIKNHQIKGDFPKGVSYHNSILNIANNSHLRDPLIIKIEEYNNEDFVIDVGASSEVKIILQVYSEDQRPHNYNFKLVVQANAKVTYLFITELASEQGKISHIFEAKKDSSLELMSGFISNVLEAKITAKLQGKNASIHIRAVAVSSTDNVQNVDIELVHEAPYTTGLMHNIAIAGSNGKVVLNGVEKILQGMIKSDAYQNLKGIIIADEASIEVNPILLIDEYDVNAGHGATVGKLEELSIYYLMSRGISQDDAKRLIINGLLNPLVSEISDEDIKNRFVKLVNDRL